MRKRGKGDLWITKIDNFLKKIKMEIEENKIEYN
jgi:hypothetical protein